MRSNEVGCIGSKEIWEEDEGAVMCKINIWEWYQSGQMPDVGVIDISNHKKLATVFKGGPAHCSKFVDDNFHHIAKTYDCKEVLIKWRGLIPLEFFTVIDQSNGNDIGPLAWFIEKARLGPQLSQKRFNETMEAEKKAEAGAKFS